MVPLQVLVNEIINFVKSWWWVPLPFLLYKPFTFLWLHWRQNLWAEEIDFIMLEVRIPKEVDRPLRAMENVFAGLWPLYDAPNWKEKWIEGEFLLPLSFEIAGIKGEPHFFIRTPEFYRDSVESNIFSQYPKAEIDEVPDYTEFVPDDIPNEEWDLWGCDFEMLRPSPYPIRTYPKFFEERPGAEAEEKVDPLSVLLEGLGKLSEDEQLWVQIVATPILNESGWITEGEEIRDEMAGRSTGGGSRKSLLREAFELLAFGWIPGGEEPEQGGEMFPEMELTAGEKKKLSAIEDKISKYGYECFARTVYLGKRDSFFKPHVKIPLSFFTQFSTSDLNGLKPWSKTITKVTYFFPDRRLDLRKQRLFNHYKNRLPPLYPRPGGTYTFNTEELATIYHFPGEEAAPAPFMERIEATKGEPPSGLPT